MNQNKVLILRMFVDFTCEECHNHEDEVGRLEPHRVKNGGDYSLRNIKMVCHKCHETYSSALRRSSGIQ